jgi:hypothetical protein
MSVDDDLPPLKARNDRDKGRMEAWVNRKLDEIDDALTEVYWASMGDAAAGEQRKKAFEEFIESDTAEIHAAEHGDIEPLRAKYPQLARFLHLPKRSGKGDRFPPRKDFIAPKYEMPDGEVVDGQNLTFACWDVPVIRELWKTHYEKVRLRGYHAPEEIAARRHNVDDAEHVFWFLKSRKRLPDLSRNQRLELARAK